MSAEAEKILSANFERAINWVKYAEAKNAALLTFATAWSIATLNLTASANAPLCLIIAALSALPLMLIAGGIAIVSFLPLTKLWKFVSKDRDAQRAHNYLFFGDLRHLPPADAGRSILDRYVSSDGKLSDAFITDIGTQIVVNSQIAQRKFNLFDAAARFVIAGFAVAALVALARLAFWGC